MAILITPSPLPTDHRLAHHAPIDFLIAKTKPEAQPTLQLKANNDKAPQLEKKTKETLVAFVFMRDNRFTLFKNKIKIKPIPAFINPP